MKDKQLKLIKQNKHLLLKSNTAQRIYNRSIFYICLYFVGIFIISLFDDNSFIFKLGSISFTAIAIPSILSLNSISFDLMKEVDNETIWIDNSQNDVTATSKDNKDEIKLLKDAVKELSKSNVVLKENLDIIKKQSRQHNYKNKARRKYK